MDGRIPLTTTQSVADQPPGKPQESSVDGESSVEVPYTDYSQEHNHPYLVDHFNLGDTWDDPQGGFPKEVSVIGDYINKKIESGEVANSVAAIKGVLKDMEKFNNLNKEERAVVKLEVLSHYVEFLMKNDQTKRNLRRYHG